MRDAPETIWATPDIYEIVDWRFGEWAEQEPDTKTKRLYRRADLPPTTDQLLADPRVQALVEALDAAADALEDYSPLTGNTIQTHNSKRARAALAALEDKG